MRIKADVCIGVKSIVGKKPLKTEIQVDKNIGEKRKKVEKGENIVNWLKKGNDEERKKRKGEKGKRGKIGKIVKTLAFTLEG